MSTPANGVATITGAQLDRLPNNKAAEIALTGGKVIAPERTLHDDLCHVPQECFSDERCAVVTRHLERIHADHGKVELPLLLASLTDSGELEIAGGAAFLFELQNSACLPVNAPALATLIVKAHKRRSLCLRLPLVFRDVQSAAIDPDAAIVELQNLIAHVETTDSGAKADRFSILSTNELNRGNYATEYLVERTLVAGQPCILAGGKKTGKTTLAIDLFLSLATGSDFLGSLPVTRKCNPLFMSSESGLSTLQETFRRIADSKGINPSDVGNMFWSADLPRFDNAADLKALDKVLSERAIDVLGIDPVYHAMPGGDAGNLFLQGTLLRNIADVCQRNGTTLILIHHTRKGIVDPFAPPELDDIAWAGFQEFARQWLLVGRRERYEPGSGEHRLWLNCGGSAGHSSLWAVDASEGVYDGHTPRHWEVQVLAASEAREAVHQRQDAVRDSRNAERMERDRRSVVNALVKFPAGETKSIVKAACGLNDGRLAPALASLIDDGSITPCEIQKASRRTPYDGFKLADSER